MGRSLEGDEGEVVLYAVLMINFALHTCRNDDCGFYTVVGKIFIKMVITSREV